MKAKLAALSEITLGSIKSFTVDGEGGVALAKVGDKIYAFEDRCSHDDGELASGHLVAGAQVECPRHGGRFDVASGRATQMPAIAPIKTYPVEIREGHIWIEIPEPVREG